MAEEHIGSLVQIDCGPSLGTYQGRISDVHADRQTITLEQPLRNGVPYKVPKITLKSEDIVDLKILQLADEFEKTVNDVLSACRSSSSVGGNNNNNGKSSSAMQFAIHHENNVIDGDGKQQQEQSSIHETFKAVRKQQHQQRVRISPDNLLRSNERKKSAKFVESGGSPSNFSSSTNNRSRSRPNEEDYNHQYQQYQHQFHQYQNQHQQQQQFGVSRGNNHGRKLTAAATISDLCAPLDFDLLAQDFDFEGNLAKFEKLPIVGGQEIGGGWTGPESRARQEAALGLLLNNLENNSGGSPSTKIVHGIPPNSRIRSSPNSVVVLRNNVSNKNIRHDENIVHDPSRVYVNAKRSWRYLTEDGVEVQCLNASQKRQLFDRALANGYMTGDGFAYSMADNAAKLSSQLIQEKGITSCRVLVTFSRGDSTIPGQIAKHVSRYLINRGHSVSWIVTDGGNDSQQQQKHDSPPAEVEEEEDGIEILNSPPSVLQSSSLVLILGRQGSLADRVSSWLWKLGGGGSSLLSGILFVECDWRGGNNLSITTTSSNDKESLLIPDEDLLLRLGLDGAGALTRLPSRSTLCWQMPCEEVDGDLKSPVYICDTNLPARFLQRQLADLGKLLQHQKVAGKFLTYKFPFAAANCGILKLRKL